MYPDIYEPTHASDGLPLPPGFRRASGFNQRQSVNGSFRVRAVVFVAVLTVIAAPFIAAVIFIRAWLGLMAG